MSREEFIEKACIAGMRAFGNEALRREHAKHLYASAVAMADVLNLQSERREDRAAKLEGEVARWRENYEAADALHRGTIAELHGRISELEEQLESATAPAPAPKARAK